MAEEWSQGGMEIEWLILCDYARVVENKLYLMGGGWDTLNVGAGFPTVQQCAIAASILVPWSETNHTHTLRIEIVDEDQKSLVDLQGEFEAGRPVGMPSGHPQRIQLAVQMTLEIPHPGTYVVIGGINQVEKKRARFLANAAPGHR